MLRQPLILGLPRSGIRQNSRTKEFWRIPLRLRMLTASSLECHDLSYPKIRSGRSTSAASRFDLRVVKAVAKLARVWQMLVTAKVWQLRLP